MTRPKSFLTYFLLCAIPLLLLAGLNYWNGLRTVDSTLGAVVPREDEHLALAAQRDRPAHQRLPNVRRMRASASSTFSRELNAERRNQPSPDGPKKASNTDDRSR